MNISIATIVVVSGLVSGAWSEPSMPVPALLRSHGFSVPFTGLAGYASAIGDLNNDGRLDFVSVDLGDEIDGAWPVAVTVRYTQPDLEMLEVGHQTTTFTGELRAPVLFDVNGDGYRDILVPPFGQSPYYFPFDGVSFGPATPLADPPEEIERFYVVDVNGKGEDQLFSRDNLGVRAWTRVAGDTFELGVPVPAAHPPIIDDFDGDRRADIFGRPTGVAGTPGIVFDLAGAQRFEPFPLLDARTIKAIGDFNKDGVVDLAIRNDDPVTQSPIFSLVAFRRGVPTIVRELPLFPEAFGDFDGDGDIDLIAGQELYRDFSVRGELASAGSTGLAPLEDRGAMDYNGDGATDVYDGFRLTNVAAFGSAIPYPVGRSLAFQTENRFDAADIDGDGDLDLCADDRRYENNGDGRLDRWDLVNPLQTPQPTTKSLGPVRLDEPSNLTSENFRVQILPDLNGDGLADRATARGRTYFSLGDFQYVEGPRFPEANNLRRADMDGDGVEDIIGLKTRSDSVTICYTRENSFEIVDLIGSGAFSDLICVDDFNGDGRQDIATLGPLRVAALLQKADGTFERFTFEDRATAVGDINAADLDGDGYKELMVVAESASQSFTSDLTILSMRPGHEMEVLRRVHIEARSFDASVCDFDADGRLDLLIAALNGVDIYLDFDQPELPQPIRLPSGNSTFAVLTPDLNGDGVPDLVADLNSGSSGTLYYPTYPLTSIAPHTCRVDLDGDGIVSGRDVATFIAAYLAQQDISDWNEDGMTNHADIVAFVKEFVEGC